MMTQNAQPIYLLETDVWPAVVCWTDVLYPIQMAQQWPTLFDLLCSGCWTNTGFLYPAPLYLEQINRLQRIIGKSIRAV
jgi:hypothetical protein